MTVIGKQGIWDNSTYPWSDTTSAGYVGSIVTEINAWITAISGNPSIVANGQLPVQLKGPSDSTDGGVTNGFVYQFPDTTIGLDVTGPTYPTLLFEGQATGVSLIIGDEYNDNGSNSGYGSMYTGSGTGRGHSTSEAWSGTSNFDREAIIAYDTTDGQEFFAVGTRLGTSSSSTAGFAVFKDTSGHWCFVLEDTGFAYDNVLGFWTGTAGSYDTDPTVPGNSQYQGPLRLEAAVPTGAANKPNYDGEVQVYWYVANPALYDGRGTTGRYGAYNFTSNDTAVIIELGYDSIAVRVPVSGGGS